MKRTQQYIKYIIILLLYFSLAGCASFPFFKKQEGEYDFLMENTEGEKPAAAAELKKPDGLKEAKLKATSAMQAGDFDSALFYFVKALEIDENDIESLMAIARIHEQNENHSLSILAFQMVLKEEENHVEAQEGLGLGLIRMNRYTQARKVLISAMANNPYRPKVYNGLGVISDLQQLYTEGQWFYARALELEPDSSITLTNLAYYHYLAGNWQRAEDINRGVLRRFPSHQQAILNMGLLKARQGKLFDAMSHLEKVLPKSHAYNELGYIMMLDKKFNVAEQLFEKAISASPSYFKKAYDNMERLKELRHQQKSPIQIDL